MRQYKTGYRLKNQPPERSTIVLVANKARTVLQHRLPLLQALQKDGYRVLVAAPFDETVGALIRVSGAEFHALQHYRRNSVIPWLQILALLEIRRLIRRRKPAAVLLFGLQSVILGNLASRKHGAGTISVITGLGYAFLHPGWIFPVVRALLSISLRNTKAVVLENSDDCAWILKHKLAKEKQTVLIRGSGIDLDHFRPMPVVQSTHPVTFTFIGRLLYDKGLREFAEAAAQVRRLHPHAIFRVVGPLDGDNPAHVKERELLHWIEAGIIEYYGDREDVRPLIAQTDWVVLPSYREGLSRVLLEAMAMERPLIATDVPGCRDLVDVGKNGFLTPVKDSRALAATLLQCCRISREDWIHMGTYSREKAAREFDSERINQQYLSLLREIANRN